jgi:hypothetical protein
MSRLGFTLGFHKLIKLFRREKKSLLYFCRKKKNEHMSRLGFTLGFTLGFHKLIKLFRREKKSLLYFL